MRRGFGGGGDEIYIYQLKRKYLFVLLISMLWLCGCSDNCLDERDAREESYYQTADMKEPETSKTTDAGETVDPAEIIETVETADTGEAPDLDKCEELSTALDMLIVYGVKYDESMKEPDEDFWNRFNSALLCNARFGPFYDENNMDKLWDNERIAEAGSLITGRELRCTCFPDGIDVTNTYSPYLAWASKTNVHIEPLEKDRFAISYDMMWAPVSLTAIDGMIRVSAIVSVNEDSPLNGFSIIELDYEEVYSCVYTVTGGFDYDVTEENDVIHEKLYQVTDGAHTTINNENLGEIFAEHDKAYVFADINDDSKDEMIVQINGYGPNFFFYTDDGILWIKSPISDDSEIWFTEDYFVMSKDSQISEDVYAAYRICNDGNFKQVMLLKNYHDENGERFACVTEEGEEIALTGEEYMYLTKHWESKKINLEWTKIS